MRARLTIGTSAECCAPVIVPSVRQVSRESSVVTVRVLRPRGYRAAQCSGCTDLGSTSGLAAIGPISFS